MGFRKPLDLCMSLTREWKNDALISMTAKQMPIFSSIEQKISLPPETSKDKPIGKASIDQGLKDQTKP